MTDLVIRPLEPGEEELFTSLPDPGLSGVTGIERDYHELAAKGQYRPEWTWVALRDGKPVARAAWWGGPDDAEPIALDCLDFTDPAAGEALLRQATLTADLHLLLPPGWREQPDVRRAAEARVEVARRTGMRPFVERLRYTWTPADPLVDKPNRLVFRPEPDDGVIFDALRRIQHDTLDAHARRAIEAGGIDAAAKEDMDFLQWMPSPREWWRLAYTTDGELVGITVPGRNYTAPVIGVVGVVPEQRGHGYSYDLLVEATHLLAEEGAEQILAATDVANTRMAATFKRAGYPISQVWVLMTPG